MGYLLNIAKKIHTLERKMAVSLLVVDNQPSLDMNELPPKADLIPRVGIEEFCHLCSAAIERINNTCYPQAEGWIDWTKKHDPAFWEQIEEGERNLDSPIDRGITLEQFSNLVGHWEALYTEAIEKYLEAQLTDKVNLVKNNPIERLIV